MFYDAFPREVGLQAPRRKTSRFIVWSKDEFYKAIYHNTPHLNVFSSVYSFLNIQDGNADYESAIIDKVFYDTDPDQYANTDDLHNAVLEVVDQLRGTSMVVTISGRGFHIYELGDTKSLQQIVNKKNYLKNVQDAAIEGTKFVLDKSCHGRLDSLARIIGTRNRKSRLFCTSLNYKELQLSYKEIQDLAQNQCFKIKIIPGTHLQYDSALDTEDMFTDFNISDIECPKIADGTLKDKLTAYGIDIACIPPCITRLLYAKEISYEERYVLIEYLKDAGLALEETRDILAVVLDPSLYYHVTGFRIGPVDRKVLEMEVEHQDLFIYKRKDYQSSCKKARDVGLCAINQCESKDILFGLV